MSSCGNHYGAQCNFSCAIGYRLNDTSPVTCVAPSNQHPGVWNNTLPTCEGFYEFKQIEIFLKCLSTYAYVQEYAFKVKVNINRLPGVNYFFNSVISLCMPQN